MSIFKYRIEIKYEQIIYTLYNKFQHLTSTFNRFKIYPNSSQIENIIACTTFPPNSSNYIIFCEETRKLAEIISHCTGWYNKSKLDSIGQLDSAVNFSAKKATPRLGIRFRCISE